MAYSKNINYEQAIQEALKTGDYKNAARAEQARNEKIAGEGLDYQPTYRYAAYLEDTTPQKSASVGGTGYINEMYNSRIDADKASLAADYDSSMAALNRAKEQIEPAYYAAKNTAASDAARSKDAWNEYAAARGLNAGTSGQAELARNSIYQSAVTELNRAEADAEADAELQRRQLQADYAAAINQVRSEQEAARNLALLEEYYRQQELQRNAEETAYSRAVQKAQILASIGDYSGYKAMGYTDAEIAALEMYYRNTL